MTSYRRIPPAIRWGADLRNRIDFGYNLDAIKAYDQSREGSEWVQAPSGVEDAWDTGTDYVLEAAARWVPGEDTADPVATGWDGAKGWREFLKWARDKNPFAFHPDGRNLIRYPDLTSADGVAPGVDGFFDRWGTLVDGPVTSSDFSFDATADGGNGAWRFVGSNSLSPVNMEMRQYVPARTDEIFTLSAEIAAVLTGGATCQLVIAFFASNLTFLTAVGSGPLTPTGTFARFSATGSSNSVVAYALIILRLNLPTGSTGTCWFKNVALRRGTDATFIPNPSILSYSLDGNAAAPEPEDDGTRNVSLRMRNATTAYDGY